MKKFNVECRRNNEEMPDSYIGDYITAETADEAIETAVDYMIEKIAENGYECERKDDKILVYENDDVAETYADFSAKEIEE